MSVISSEGGDLPLWQCLRFAPVLDDAAGAGARLEDFLAKDGAALQALAALPRVRALLLALANHSSYLWHLAAADPQRLKHCLEMPPSACLGACLERVAQACSHATSEADVMRELRLAKQKVALLVAMADLGGAFDVPAATQALSKAADILIEAALSFLLREAAAAGKLHLPNASRPTQGCGLCVLALGKLGGRELNYSSDVDLAVYFDPLSPALPQGSEPAPLFLRITKGLVRLLQERTADGYVLRVDLRLRPDPGATPIAMSLPAAYAYYESLGQNWERAALIKARPVAGDKALGQAFLAGLAPFIWRKYFDYAAIADIAAMKRQIHAVHGHAQIAVQGYDVKLGRGGIREIEFFVQTQQLIFGGKRARLRGSRTLEMLEELNSQGWITRRAADDLRAAYLFLREIEHRLQMIADEQTQRLPGEPHALERFARFCGFSCASSFAHDVTHHLTRVSHHYARLFEHAPGLDTAAGSLIFTGSAIDPETIETLLQLGFKNAPAAAETIRGWHFGRRRGVRTPREREVLTELTPQLLQAFSHTGDPDAAIAGFDTTLDAMPAVAELFSLLKSNPSVCELFGDILGGAPRLARAVASRPHVLDSAIDANALTAALDENAFRQRAAAVLQQPKDTEEFLDALRDFAQEEMFPIGLRLWSSMMTPSEAAAAYSALAQIVIEVALAHIEDVFTQKHGRIASGKHAVLALGKLGSREMTATSDLDLMFIYEFDPAQPESQGPEPLHAVRYYARMAQRLISALTVATRRGRLYDVDMRLRPSGRQGPLATQFQSFVEYQAKEAAAWEHMALIRARPVAGVRDLAERISGAIRSVLTRQRGDELREKVYDMRRLIAEAKGDNDPWDLKLAAGGLIDIEFIAQYLLLRHAHEEPALVCSSSTAIIERAARSNLLEEDQASKLTGAYHLFSDVTQIQRLSLDAGADPRQAAEAVKRRLARAAGEPSLSALESRLSDMRLQVRGIFESLLSAN